MRVVTMVDKLKELSDKRLKALEILKEKNFSMLINQDIFTVILSRFIFFKRSFILFASLSFYILWFLFDKRVAKNLNFYLYKL